MHFLLTSAWLGGVLTATLVWLWQDDWVFALLLAADGHALAPPGPAIRIESEGGASQSWHLMLKS
jgi:hypothetical protein